MLNAKISGKETKYTYDVEKNRVGKVITGGGIKNETRYINSDYEEQINGSGTIKKIKYILAFGEKFLTVEDEKTIYNLSDHLGGGAIDTNSSGAILQMSDYLPYGGKRVLVRNNYKNNYLFIGKELDEETGLQYFEARYYNGDLGRFYSQDRVFWELGNTKRRVSILADPQQLNSYAYSRNNPVLYTDPSGETSLILEEGGNLYVDLFKVYVEAITTIGVFLLTVVSNNIIDNYYAEDSTKMFAKSKEKEKSKIEDNASGGGGGRKNGGDKEPEDDKFSNLGTITIVGATGKIIKKYTSKEFKEMAESFGYKEVKGLSSGEKVFYNKDAKKYITGDNISHNGGIWKMADSIKNLFNKETRLETYDINLNRIGD